ncbi:AzlC family ABC transporter permease [Kitasatospora sp. NPDC004745]|uniref:AzlC family ABC transporter permease n=1 Tax=unclassified Kitasatospora TaxID=2633591 RepID=UPI0033C10027
MLPRHSRGAEAAQGVLSVVPVVLGAVPFGLLFGALAQERGLGLGKAMLMSLLINAGSAQIVSLGMITAGAAWPLTVVTVLLINLRHVFYSAALAPYVRPMGFWWRFGIAWGMTDAVYALAAKRFGEPAPEEDNRRWYVLSGSAVIYAAWALSTLCGWVFGASLSGLGEWGLDFAVYATYIGLVVSTFTSRRALAVGLVAGVGALLLHHLPYQSGLFVGTLAGTALAAFLESRERVAATPVPAEGEAAAAVPERRAAPDPAEAPADTAS